jgi:hypothetical protein
VRAAVAREGIIARLALAAVVGLVVGAGTSFAQQYLGGTSAALANSASPWLAGAFVAGLLQRGRGIAIGAGLATCVLEVVAYYATTAARGYAVAQTEIVFWTVCALLGGPLFGWAGWAWRAGPHAGRAAAGAFLPATFLGEGVGAYLVRLHYDADAALFVVIAAALLALVAVAADVAWTRLVVWTVGLGALAALLYGPVLDVVAGAAFGG